MKIDNITLALFTWDGIPATQYGQHTGKFSGQSQLGLLTIGTDDGAEGHAFLGVLVEPVDGREMCIPKPGGNPDHGLGI